MELINDNKIDMDDYAIEFDAELSVSKFEEYFLQYINQGSKGSFRGKIEGFAEIKKIIDVAEYNTLEGIEKLIDNIIEHLRYDFLDGRGKEKRFITDQLRKDISLSIFYDYIYGLDYLLPNYQLKLGGKKLSELSPGERGALLLIFYLLLDKGEIPLIIDQPEENLDKQSVYNIIVKYIKKAKENRQVIIVTHNPNLAVVCDAEQIIRVHIEKENQNKLTYISGSIENKEINREILRILEGTKPAFINRKQKYENANKDI